jgi:hypothetical protein
LITGLLLLVAISGAALAYYFLRQRAPESASNVLPTANSNQATESSNTNSTLEETTASAAEPQTEAKPLVEETPLPTPKPSASVEPTRDTRARQERTERTTEATASAATPTPAPLGSPTPIAQATPVQTPAPSPTSGGKDSGKATEQQAKSDAFYFQAVNVINGRDPRSLKRAELLYALQLFQNVKGGPHVEEARRQAQRLDRELNRQNKQSQR